MTFRYALYFTPEPDSPFELAGAICLGRNARTGRSGAPLSIDGIPTNRMLLITAAPRRYGFHGTLKAPFRLAADHLEASLIEATAHLASLIEPFEMPQLSVRQLGNFITLKPEADSDALRNLADRCVAMLDPLRAEMTPEDRARRKPDQLSDQQRNNLDRWGYPYVFEEFRFHMTLAGPVDAAEAPVLIDAYRLLFEPVLANPISVNTITVFQQNEPDQPFHIRQRFSLQT